MSEEHRKTIAVDWPTAAQADFIADLRRRIEDLERRGRYEEKNASDRLDRLLTLIVGRPDAGQGWNWVEAWVEDTIGRIRAVQESQDVELEENESGDRDDPFEEALGELFSAIRRAPPLKRKLVHLELRSREEIVSRMVAGEARVRVLEGALRSIRDGAEPGIRAEAERALATTTEEPTP